MPFTKSSSRLVRAGAHIALTCQYVRNPDTGTVTPSVNGVFQATTTKADGIGAMQLVTGQDEVPPLMSMLTDAERAQLTALCDKAFTAFLDRYGLTES